MTLTRRNFLSLLGKAGIGLAVASSGLEVLAGEDDFHSKIQKQLERHEGYHERTYPDSLGIPTIGIGFNLDRQDAAEKIRKLGADYDKVRTKKQDLTREQIYALFNEDLDNAEKTAKQLIKNYDSQPENIKLVVVDMAFNLGATKFRNFKKTISCIEASDYENAAREMESSKWYRQVGNRSKYLVRLMRTAKP